MLNDWSLEMPALTNDPSLWLGLPSTLKTDRHQSQQSPTITSLPMHSASQQGRNAYLAQGRGSRHFTEQPDLKEVDQKHCCGHFENVKPAKLAVEAG